MHGVYIGLGIGLVVLGFVAAMFGPRWQARRWRLQGLTEKEIVDSVNASRTTIVQAVGGLAVAAAVVISWTQLTDTRHAADKAEQTASRNLVLAEREQTTQRFTLSVNELQNKQTATRIGGIYGLAQVASDSRQYGRAIAEIMVTYLHDQTPIRASAPDPLDAFVGLAEPRCDTLVTPPIDVQAAFSVLMQIAEREHLSGLDLAGLNLSGVVAHSGYLVKDDLSGTSLADADLRQSQLDAAKLPGADLRLSCLNGTSLNNAKLGYADLRGASLRDADLRTAMLQNAMLGWVDASSARNFTTSQQRFVHPNKCTAFPEKPVRCPTVQVPRRGS